jgi:hypothetical protein
MKDHDPGQIGLHLLTIRRSSRPRRGPTTSTGPEAMAAIDLGRTGVLATFLGTDPINVGATPNRRPMARRAGGARHFGAYGATEPQAGATKLGDHGRPVEEARVVATVSAAASSGSATVPPTTRSANAPGASWSLARDGGFHRQAGGQTRHPRLEHRRFFPRTCTSRRWLIGLVEARALPGPGRLRLPRSGGRASARALEALRRAIRYSQERVQGAGAAGRGPPTSCSSRTR